MLLEEARDYFLGVGDNVVVFQPVLCLLEELVVFLVGVCFDVHFCGVDVSLCVGYVYVCVCVVVDFGGVGLFRVCVCVHGGDDVGAFVVVGHWFFLFVNVFHRKFILRPPAAVFVVLGAAALLVFLLWHAGCVLSSWFPVFC